jgi:hypothetical protein
MKYITVEEAKSASGLRLVLTGGLPAPWSEGAKGVFRARNVDYIPVLQKGGAPNEALVEWTGHRNAPTALYNDEPARVSAVDMINLGERLGSGPSLVPDNIYERVLMFGLLNELAGENGLAWNARVLMFGAMIETAGEEAMADNPMLREYHYSSADLASAPGRVINILQTLSAQLESQREIGSRYFIGENFSALDIYWACFSQMLDALPADVNPMPDFMRHVWGLLAKSVTSTGYDIDPALLAHRDFIFPNHLQWPLDF